MGAYKNRLIATGDSLNRTPTHEEVIAHMPTIAGTDGREYQLDDTGRVIGMSRPDQQEAQPFCMVCDATDHVAASCRAADLDLSAEPSWAQ